MRRWPPLIWILIAVGSLFVTRGAVGEFNAGALIGGALLILIGFALALYLALSKHTGPRPRSAVFAVAGCAAIYIVLAAAASVAGSEYSLAALAAGVIPLTAVSLIVATVRLKTAHGDADDDPVPGLSLDDETPLGDTSEHSDALDAHGSRPNDPRTAPQSSEEARR